MNFRLMTKRCALPLHIDRSTISHAALIVVAMLALTSLFATIPHANAQSNSKWHPWFEFGGYYNSRSDDATGSFGTSRGETSIFAPLRGGERALLFGQLTAKFFGDDAQEGNFALGYRHMLPTGFNLGGWIGADVRNTEIDNTFWQLSGGLEALSHNFDARLNWYGPVTGPKAGVAGFAQAQLVGSQIFITGGEEVALRGIDGELGLRIPTEFARIDPRLLNCAPMAAASTSMTRTRSVTSRVSKVA